MIAWLSSSVVHQQAHRVVVAVGDGLVALVGVVAALAIAWLKARFSAPHQVQATLDAALDTERWARDEVAAGRAKPPSKVKKARTQRDARAALPWFHKPLLPGAHGRKVEQVMPAMRRLSAPPPQRDVN